MIVFDVYADLACPWCYIGERRLHKALAQRPDIEVELNWRPFQLNPRANPAGEPWDEHVEQKFGARARQMFEHVTRAGATEGLDFAFDRIASAPNTVDAHRLILFAGRHGKAWDMADRLFRAYFAGGRDLNDHSQLAELAASVGLDSAAVREYLPGDEGRDAVMQSQQQAYRLGISGVPFFVVNGRYGVSGAQPVDVFLEVLDTVQEELEAESA